MDKVHRPLLRMYRQCLARCRAKEFPELYRATRDKLGLRVIHNDFSFGAHVE